MNNITIEECIKKFEEGVAVILNDGKVIGFEAYGEE